MSPTSSGSVDPGLDPLLCFDLYAAQRAVTATYRPILSELGLTYPQYLVLTLLWTRDARPIKDLATSLRLDHATLTPLLRRMESAGLIVRERSVVDERSITVRLAEAGRELSRHSADITCRVNESFGLDADQVVVLSGLLRGLSARLEALAPRTGPREGPSGDPEMTQA